MLNIHMSKMFSFWSQTKYVRDGRSELHGNDMFYEVKYVIKYKL